MCIMKKINLTKNHDFAYDAFVLDNVLCGTNVQARMEAIIIYLLRKEKLPFILSEAEETELFELLKSLNKSSYNILSILGTYVKEYGIKSSKAQFIFNKMRLSNALTKEIRAIFDEFAENNDSCVYTPVPFSDEQEVFSNGEIFDSTTERFEKIKEQNEAKEDKDEDFDFN